MTSSRRDAGRELEQTFALIQSRLAVPIGRVRNTDWRQDMTDITEANVTSANPAVETESESTLLPMLIVGLVLTVIGAAVVMAFV